MRREHWELLLLWAVLALIIGGVAYYALGDMIQAVGDVLSAVVAAAAVLMGAVLTHILNQQRDERLEEQKRVRDQRLAEQQRMENNYLRIVSEIDRVIRHNGDDNFSKIYLESWVVGSLEVTENIRLLMEKTGAERKEPLKKLMNSIRKDLGLSEHPVELANIFPPQPVQGHLGGAHAGQSTG